jgi:hypothetical protein
MPPVPHVEHPAWVFWPSSAGTWPNGANPWPGAAAAGAAVAGWTG